MILQMILHLYVLRIENSLCTIAPSTFQDLNHLHVHNSKIIIAFYGIPLTKLKYLV